MAGKSIKPIKWIITPELHERIKDLYHAQVGMTNQGVVREFAKSIGYPKWKISRYAVKQGWATRQHKEPDWSGREKRLLQSSGHLSIERIQKNLARAGFRRSLTGIVLKRKRMRVPSNLQGQSARSVALCFGVDDHVITRWIRLGWLKAHKRGTKRHPQQGGDIYYIKDCWIREFIIQYIAEIDLRKVDKYWLVDLLAGGPLGLGSLAGPALTHDRPEFPEAVSGDGYDQINHCVLAGL